MKSKFYHVYQFKVVLENIDPPVWRRIQVPEDYTFWDFHVALQGSMGWTDSHMHQFEAKNPKTEKNEVIGIPEDVYDGIIDGEKTLPCWKLYIRDYFSEENRKMFYLYDFGDSWNHHIEYESILFKKNKQKYPLCVAGERACPPEDCGGSFGYENLLEILNNPRHEEYKASRIWAGKNFNPEKFDATKIRFDNPQLRWTQTWARPNF
jgi:Plasmid pRiA4b ORF-3-like protein